MPNLFILILRAFIIGCFATVMIVHAAITDYLWLTFILLGVVVDIALFNTLPDKIACAVCCILSFVAGIKFYKQFKKIWSY